jgi:hypothetical protein
MFDREAKTRKLLSEKKHNFSFNLGSGGWRLIVLLSVQKAMQVGPAGR